MSVNRVGSSNNDMSDFRNKILGSTAIGALAGGVYSATKTNWIYKGLPSDQFVRNVSTNLRKDMTSDELKESAKISKFLSDVVKPETDLETLKPQIRDSKELSEAIKSAPEEELEDAITRVFSQPKDKVKQDLTRLQFKTKSNKKINSTTALKLINDNFDASNKKLVKNPETSEKVFNMIKSTANKIQAKSVAVASVLSGAVVGALALVVTKVPGEDKG